MLIMGMKRRSSFIGLVVLVLGLTIFASGCSDKKDESKIFVSGTVEATETNVNAELNGKINEISIQEGSMVKQGAILARIDSTIPALQVQQAEAALNAARESSKQTKTGNRQQQIAQAQAGVEQIDALSKGARQSMENALENLGRIKTLVKDGGATTQQLSDAQTKYETAKAQYEAYVAQKRSAQEQLDLLKSGSTQETINIANAGVAQAQASLAIARAQLAKAVIYAPSSGIINEVNFEKGEFVAPGAALFTLINPKDLWIKVYVSEKDLPKVKVGNKAEIFADAYPDKTFAGRVSYISSKAEFTPKNLQTAEERVNMVFEVKIKITGGEDQLKAGLPADVNIIL